MPLSFLPRVLTRSLTDLTPEYLLGKGIRLLMMDFDNTIVPYTTDVPTDGCLAGRNEYVSRENSHRLQQQKRTSDPVL